MKWIWQLPWDPSPTPSNTTQGAPIEDNNTSAIHINDPIVTGGYNMKPSDTFRHRRRRRPPNLSDTKQKKKKTPEPVRLDLAGL